MIKIRKIQFKSIIGILINTTGSVNRGSMPRDSQFERENSMKGGGGFTLTGASVGTVRYTQGSYLSTWGISLQYKELLALILQTGVTNTVCRAHLLRSSPLCLPPTIGVSLPGQNTQERNLNLRYQPTEFHHRFHFSTLFAHLTASNRNNGAISGGFHTTAF